VGAPWQREEGVPRESVQSTEPAEEEDAGEEGDVVVTVL
jgi:hypothetical protein